MKRKKKRRKRKRKKRSELFVPPGIHDTLLISYHLNFAPVRIERIVEAACLPQDADEGQEEEEDEEDQDDDDDDDEDEEGEEDEEDAEGQHEGDAQDDAQGDEGTTAADDEEDYSDLPELLCHKCMQPGECDCDADDVCEWCGQSVQPCVCQQLFA